MVGEVEKTIVRCLSEISERQRFIIIITKCDKDHIHILFEYNSNVQLNKLIKLIKQQTTRNVWDKHFDELKSHFWKRKIFWSSGYYVSSVGNVSTEVVEKYIEEQGKCI